jgi:hypothetical protein
MDHFIAPMRFRWHNWRRERLLTPASLANFESKAFSQNGEDGILLEIFRRIGDGQRYAVEFGVDDGTECCTRNLLVHHDWSGLLLEGSSISAEKARSLYSNCSTVRVVQAFVTAENILEIFLSYGVPQSPDLLVVDVDGNDYWILSEFSRAISRGLSCASIAPDGLPGKIG